MKSTINSARVPLKTIETTVSFIANILSIISQFPKAEAHTLVTEEWKISHSCITRKVGSLTLAEIISLHDIFPCRGH